MAVPSAYPKASAELRGIVERTRPHICALRRAAINLEARLTNLWESAPARFSGFPVKKTKAGGGAPAFVPSVIS